MKQLFSRSEFTKNTIILLIGTVAAQGIPLLLQPWLRRIYSPEDFGAMAVYLNIFGMATIVSALRYEATIVLPKENKESANIVALTFILTILLNTIFFVAILFFKNNIAQWIGLSEKYSGYLYFLPVAAAFFSMYQSLNYWLIRQKAFKASSINKIIRRGVEGAVQVVLGILKFPAGLLAGDFLGNLANVISGIKQAKKKGLDGKLIKKEEIKHVFKKHIDYPKYNVLPTLLSSAATVIPFLLINKFYSTEVMGYVDLSRMALSIPLVLISASISQVFFQQTTEKKHNNKSIKRDIQNIIYILLTVVAVEMLVILFWGPELFSFVFGEQYALSGSFSQILIFSFTLNFLSSTFSSVFITFGRISLNSIWQVVHFCAICSLFFLKTETINGFLKTYVALESFMYIVYCFMVYFIVNRYEKKIKSVK